MYFSKYSTNKDSNNFLFLTFVSFQIPLQPVMPAPTTKPSQAAKKHFLTRVDEAKILKQGCPESTHTCKALASS
jgi:enamine deaminase RidA (YjgF/YER057c/UK114 family)